jgi:hypothetical protein
VLRPSLYERKTHPSPVHGGNLPLPVELVTFEARRRAATVVDLTWRTEFACTLPRGGVLLMRPLLLHASSPSAMPAHRRVIHIEYATGELPAGLTWAEQ